MEILIHAAEGSISTGIGQHVFYLGKGLIEEGFKVKYIFGRDSSKLYKGYQQRFPKKLIDEDLFISPLFFKLAINKNKFDIIHSHAQIAYNSIYWYPEKSITTLHGTDHGVYEQYLLEKEKRNINKNLGTDIYFKVTLVKEKFAHKRAKLLISVSKGVDLEALRFFHRSTCLALNGVDCDEFRPDDEEYNLRKSFGISKDQIIILFIGQNDWRKGLRYLISALDDRKNKYKIIIGGLPKKYVHKNVISLGFLDHNLKKRLLASCDIFCLPSLYEGMSLVMLEAMACGKPCLLTDVHGTDIISNYKDGIIVPKRNIEKIREGLDYLSEKTMREEIGWRARETAERYPWSRTVKSTIHAYEKSKLI